MSSSAFLFLIILLCERIIVADCFFVDFGYRNNGRTAASAAIDAIKRSQITHHSRARSPINVILTHSSASSSSSEPASNTKSTRNSDAEACVSSLKRVLEKEYVSFFDPMVKEYYSKDVTFEDPMTSLSGVESYQKNVDMLASRTLMGSLLFEDASIVLHSVEGGHVTGADTDTESDACKSSNLHSQVQISNIITRWTLRVTAKILPWKPTARFSGISVYDVKYQKRGDADSVSITHQTDFWDSINIKPNSGGSYQRVDKSIAIQDFLGQLKPENFNAPSAGIELPSLLLRRGDGYEVRKYPSFVAVQIPYQRRDEAFSTLGTFTSDLEPLSPAIIDVTAQRSRESEESSSLSIDKKLMMWPIGFTPPSSNNKDTNEQQIRSSSAYQKANEKLEKYPEWVKQNCQIVVVPSSIVAIKRFSDASVQPVVQKVDAELRQMLKRDGIIISKDTEDKITFAQYDAIFSMGKRRGEVWISLQNGGHPW